MGHTKPQKNLPKIKVSKRTIKDNIKTDFMVPVVNRVVIPINGSMAKR